MRSRALAVLLAAFGLAGLGCDALPQVSVIPNLPQARADALRLVRAPGALEIAAALCPQVASRVGLAGGESACALAVGSPPPPGALDLVFDLPIEVSNTEGFSIPVPALALALDLWPDDATARTTTSACVVFRRGDDAAVPQGAGPCPEEPGGGVSASQLLALATAQDWPGAADNLDLRVIPPHAQQTLDVYWRVAPERVVAALRPLGEQVVEQVLAGQGVEPQVPYRATGTLYVDLPFVGRQDVDLGAVSGTWTFSGLP